MASELKPDTPQSEQPVESTGLIPAAIDRSLQMVQDVLGSTVRPALHNFDGTGQDQWRLTAIAMSPEAKSMDDVQGQRIFAKYFYATRIEFEKPEDGEIVNVCRCVIIDENDVPYAFVSDGIADSLSHLVAAYGLKPWVPPVPIKFVSIKTRKGFKTYRIMPA